MSIYYYWISKDESKAGVVSLTTPNEIVFTGLDNLILGDVVENNRGDAYMVWHIEENRCRAVNLHTSFGSPHELATGYFIFYIHGVCYRTDGRLVQGVNRSGNTDSHPRKYQYHKYYKDGRISRWAYKAPDRFLWTVQLERYQEAPKN